MSQNPSSLDDFGGTARLFPLPNLVLFPHVVQPLHIFEARYRQMMADALDDDRLLAMALLRPGWEEEYDKRPAIHPMVCLGRIAEEERLADGRYNLMLQGLSRARVVATSVRVGWCVTSTGSASGSSSVRPTRSTIAIPRPSYSRHAVLRPGSGTLPGSSEILIAGAHVPSRSRPTCSARLAGCSARK